jgi:hypothetical protein
MLKNYLWRINSFVWIASKPAGFVPPTPLLFPLTLSLSTSTHFNHRYYQQWNKADGKKGGL